MNQEISNHHDQDQYFQMKCLRFKNSMKAAILKFGVLKTALLLIVVSGSMVSTVRADEVLLATAQSNIPGESLSKIYIITMGTHRENDYDIFGMKVIDGITDPVFNLDQVKDGAVIREAVGPLGIVIPVITLTAEPSFKSKTGGKVLMTYLMPGLKHGYLHLEILNPRGEGWRIFHQGQKVSHFDINADLQKGIYSVTPR